MDDGRCADWGRHRGVVDFCASHGYYGGVLLVELSQCQMDGALTRQE